MSWRYILGWALVAAALISAFLELAARGAGATEGWLISAQDAWSIMWPDAAARLRALARSLPLYDLIAPPVNLLLSLPGWLLFGVPGSILVWRHHPVPEKEDGDIDEDSLFLFDRLSDRAREEGTGDDAPRPGMPPPRFLDHAREGDDAEDGLLPRPVRSLHRPPFDDEGPDRLPPGGARP